MKTKGTIWVLGASSGLALSTANAFAEDGWLVVAGARSFSCENEPEKSPEQLTDGIRKLKQQKNVHLFPLDVTKEESCDAFIARALSFSAEVDAVCYGAGLLVLGSCEEITPAEYENVMQTNFFGMTRMVQKVLPIMRKQMHGKIILFSSLNGLLGIPFQSAYTASKHAIEGYAQCLAMETIPFGIQVSVVEPGDHRSGSLRYRLRTQGHLSGSPYKNEFESACETIHHDENNGLFPDALGRIVVHNSNRKKMHYRVRVAKIDQRLAVWLSRLLWPRLFFFIMRKYYGERE